MSSEFNDMERMFQEGLQNYEVTPPAHVWSNIQRRKRKGLFFYKWRIASILLLLCVAGTSAYYFISENDNTKNSSTISQAEKSATDKDVLAQETNTSPKLSDIVNSEIGASNSVSNSTVTEKNKVSISEKSRKNRVEKRKKAQEFVNDFTNNEASAFDTKDLLVTIASKDRVKLKYIVYPSLMQYIYTTKRLGKKYIVSDNEEKEDKRAYNYSIEIVGGPTYAFRRLSGNGALLRDESEKAAMGTLTGIKINYNFNTKWTLQTGLTFENRHERISYNRTEIQQKLTVTPHQVTVFHPVLPPKTITVMDSVYTNENVDYKFNSINKYQTFNIPAVVGYNFGLGKMQYRISAGPLFNIYSINTANNLVKNGDKIEMAPYKESTKIKVSVYSAVAFVFPLNQNYDIFTEVSYYSNLGNRLNKEAVLRQKNYGLNLCGGLKINLIK